MSLCPPWVASNVSEGTIRELVAPCPSVISFGTLFAVNRQRNYVHFSRFFRSSVNHLRTACCLILEDLHNAYTGSGAHPDSCLVGIVR